MFFLIPKNVFLIPKNVFLIPKNVFLSLKLFFLMPTPGYPWVPLGTPESTAQSFSKL